VYIIVRAPPAQGPRHRLRPRPRGIDRTINYLVEKNGRCMQYRHFPGEPSAPVQVEPNSEKYHEKLVV
jgi:hypothetical protein